MTGKIKLNATSGGGSVSIQAPSSTGDDRIITLPTTADGTVLTTTNPKAGNIIQVKSATKTDQQTSTSGDWIDITGLSVDMAISSSGNKILMSYDVTTGANWWNLGPVYLRFMQDTTAIGIGTVNGNSTTFANLYADSASNSNHNTCQQSATFLFSPSDTNSHTYKVQSQGNNTSGYGINRWWANPNITATSNITLMEVAV